MAERSTCTDGCRRECSLAGLGLNHPDPHLMTIAQWKWHPLVYVTYRLVAAAYFFVWIIYSGTKVGDFSTSVSNHVKWFIYLTNWCDFVLTSCLIIQAVIATYSYLRIEKKGQVYTMTWYLKMQWVWYNIALNSGFLLTVLYWSLIYQPTDAPVHEVNVHTHAINSIYLIIDLFITAMPLRLLHFLHGVSYATVYIVFSVIYTMAGGTNARDSPRIYRPLDWKGNPGLAALYSTMSTLVGFPIIWLIQYALYRVRLALATCCSPASGLITSQGTPGAGRSSTERAQVV